MKRLFSGCDYIIIENTVVRILAFVNDLLVFAESKEHLQQLVLNISCGWVENEPIDEC